MEPSSPVEAATGRRKTVGISAAALVLALAAGLPALASGPDGGPSPRPESSASSSDQSGHDGGTADSDGRNRQAGSTGATNRSGTSQGGNEAKDGTNSPSGHPGNNGHVFIHDKAGDFKPYNVPHVGCSFWVDFWGFDADQSLTLSFVGQAPTGKGTALAYNGGPVTIAHDAKADGDYFDTEVPVTLDPSVLGAPHPKQGYHVKLTIRTGQPGGHGVKHKVFWLSPCSGASTPAGAAANGGSVQGATAKGDTPQGATAKGDTPQGASANGGAAQGATASAGATGALGATLHRDSKPRTNVLGTALRAAPKSSGLLPFTGAPLAAMLAAAAVALGGGLGLNALGRRRRNRAAQH